MILWVPSLFLHLNMQQRYNRDFTQYFRGYETRLTSNNFDKSRIMTGRYMERDFKKVNLYELKYRETVTHVTDVLEDISFYKHAQYAKTSNYMICG